MFAGKLNRKESNRSTSESQGSNRATASAEAVAQSPDTMPDTMPHAAVVNAVAGSPQVKQFMAYQRMADTRQGGSQSGPSGALSAPSGLPGGLQSGMEQLSGYALNDVKVHYNSSYPAQLKAHAYAQGSAIHIAPGQERHLPHEAWHVVQQKQGRVQADRQMKGDAGVNTVGVNTDVSLEREADVMGARALAQAESSGAELSTSLTSPSLKARAMPNAAAPVQGFFKLDANDIEQEALVTSSKASFPVQQRGAAGATAKAIKAAIIANDMIGKNNLLDTLKTQVDGTLWTKIDALRNNHPALRELLFRQVRAHEFYESPVKKSDKGKLRLASKLTIPSLKISDNGKLAVEDVGSSDEAKTFFALSTEVKKFNKQLGSKSKFELVPMPSQKLTVPNWDNTGSNVLVQVYAKKRGTKVTVKEEAESSTQGLTALEETLINKLVTPEQCIEMAEDVTGSGLEKNPVIGKSSGDLPNDKIMADMGTSFVKYLMVYFNSRQGGLLEKASVEAAKVAAKKMYNDQAGAQGLLTGNKVYSKFQFYVSGHSAQKNAKKLYDSLILSPLTTAETDKKRTNVEEDGSTGNWFVSCGFLTPVVAANDTGAIQVLLTRGLNIEALRAGSEYRVGKKYGWVRTTITMMQAKAERGQEKYMPGGIIRRNDVLRTLRDEFEVMKVRPEFRLIAKELGINEYATPTVGQAYASYRSGLSDGAPYHWTGVVANDGKDTIALENYQRGSGKDNDLRAFFAMYGPMRAFEEEYDELTWREGTWFGQHDEDYHGIATVHKPS